MPDPRGRRRGVARRPKKKATIDESITVKLPRDEKLRLQSDAVLLKMGMSSLVRRAIEWQRTHCVTCGKRR